MVKRALIGLAKLLLFIAVVWLVVMAYWKYTDHVVSSEDLLLYFVVLPVVLLLAYFLLRILRAAIKKLSPRVRTPIDVGAARALTAVPAEAQNLADHKQPLYVVATAVCTHFGEEAAQILNAILRDKARADIHATFSQALGYGVRVAEVSDLDPPTPQESGRDTLSRTLALLEKLHNSLADVLSAAAPHPESLPNGDSKRLGVQLHPEWRAGPTHREAIAEAVSGTEGGGMPAKLTVHIVLPEFLAQPEIEIVHAAVQAWLQTVGWPKPAVALFPVQVAHEEEYLKRLRAWQQSSRDQSSCEWLLILSAVSWLDIDLLEHKLQKDAAFSDRLSRGGALVGEAACGMVLANTKPGEEWAFQLTQLSLITLAQRDKPVDARGTAEARLLTEMLADQLGASTDHATELVGVVASGDLNDGRAVELGRWVTDALPQLDFIDDVINVGDNLGDCGACSSVLALILATALAQERNGKALFCANQHASWRALAIAQPLAA